MLSFKARWIFTARGEPIRDGVVHIEDDRIVGIEQGRGGEGVRDLGRVAVLPGLINAHTHLELTGIAAPLGRPGTAFVEWIELVVGQRWSEGYDAARAVRCGLDESAVAGVAAIGDIVQTPPEDTGSEILLTGFLELIGQSASRMSEALARAADYVEAGQGRGPRRGLSPHAPYSVGPEVIEGACRLSRERRFPVAFHLAESREEMELLRWGTGPFRELLEGLDVWDPAVQHPGRRPLDFLEMLSDADRALVIHGNYLDEEEVRFIAQRGERMSVVYCPRTHAWFKHDRYRLESMLAAGVNVALGTDSRASSPDLNLLEEMRAVARRHPAVSAEKILEMGTLAGARALGVEADLGSLEPGKLARLAIVELADDKLDDPYGAVLAR